MFFSQIYQVRQLLTSILLEVTSAEIHTLVNEVLMEFTGIIMQFSKL